MELDLSVTSNPELQATSSSNGKDVPFTVPSTNKPISNLFSAVTSRRMVQKDAQLIANRISLLRAEEQRAQKRIEETKRKAAQIAEARERNCVRAQEKAQHRFETEQRIAAANERIKKYRTDRESERRRISTAILQDRQMTVQDIRQKRFENGERCRMFKDQIAATNRSKSNMVRKVKSLAKKRVSDFHEQRNRSFQDNYHSRINRELSERALVEQEVMKMEVMEAELIKRLQNTQNRQQQAYDELASMLVRSKTPPSVFVTAKPKVGGVIPRTMPAAAAGSGKSSLIS